MKPSRLVLGLYDATGEECGRTTRARLRDLSLSWARFGYQCLVIEGTRPGPILDEAVELGFDFCLLLATGTIIDENWYPAHWSRRDLHGSLVDLMNDGDFVAAGRLLEGPPGPPAIDARCLLVNLKRYLLSGRPEFEGASVEQVQVAGPAPGLPGHPPAWSISGATSEKGAEFRVFDPDSALAVVDLVSPQGDATGVAAYLGEGIQEFFEGESSAGPRVTTALQRLLAKVRHQVVRAKRGVFPWNLESYDDVDLPLPGLNSPLTAVYCVAAGFKPYRILKSRGYDRDTRVVFFDYSPRALEFRQLLLREWDGTDYPTFLRKAFGEMPPDSYFQLWANLSPDQVRTSDLDQLWTAETDRWGGREAFQEHWTLCRSLTHEFVLCDLLEGPSPVLERLSDEPDQVLWWSNAFFTIYSNWFFTIAERRQRYARFIRGLAERAPGLYLYGADHMNSSVNSIRADEYAARLETDAGDASDGLIPARSHRLQIRS
jgi:hypothetical protein